MSRGSIRQRGNAWQLRVEIGDDQQGKRQQVARTFRGTRRDAERALTQLQREVDQNIAVTSAKATVGDLLNRWFEAAGPDLAPSTQVITRGIIDKHLIPGLGQVPLSKLTTADIDVFYGKLRRKGLKPISVQRIHGVLRRALEVGRKSWRLIAVNPAADANVGKVTKRPVNAVTPGTASAMITAMADRDPFTARLLRLMAATGARPRGTLRPAGERR
jgi:integrase